MDTFKGIILHVPSGLENSPEIHGSSNEITKTMEGFWYILLGLVLQEDYQTLGTIKNMLFNIGTEKLKDDGFLIFDKE